MFYYDLKKLLLNKKNVVLLGILLLFQCMLFLMWNVSSTVVGKDYQQIQTQIQGMKLEEANTYLHNEITENTTPVQDHDTLQRVLEENQHLIDYPQYYKSIVEGQGEETISIFKDKNKFSKELRTAVRQHYVGKDLDAGSSSKGSYGIEQMLAYPLFDIAVLLLIVYMMYLQVDREQDTGSILYVKTMKKGNYKNYLSKYGSISLVAIMFMIISYCLIYVVSGMIYGFMDLSLPVQSILSCGSVSSALNIFQFLIIAVGLRCLLFALLIFLLYAMLSLLGRTIYGLSVFLVILLIGNIAASVSADQNSILKFLSITQLLHPEKLFIDVRYYSIFQHAVYFIIPYIILVACSIVINVFAYKCYQRGRNHRHTISFRITEKKHHSLLFYEIKKSWIKGFGLIAVSFLLLFVGSTLHNIKTLSYMDDKVIAYYIDTFGNTPTTSTYKKIEAEKNRFDTIYKKIQEADNEMDKRMLSEQLNNEQAFIKYCERMDKLNHNTSRKVLKEDQFRMFFEQSTMYAKFLMCFFPILILLSMYSFAKEQDSGVILFQKISNIGKNQIFRYKFTSICMLALTTWLVIAVMVFLYNGHMYSGISWFSSFNDLYQVSFFPININIILYLCIQLLLQLCSIFMMTYCIMFAFSKTKYNKQMALVLLLISIVPFVLILANILEVPYLMALFYPFMSFKKFLISFILLMGIFAFCIYKRKKECCYA